MIGVTCEKENFGSSSGGVGRTQPDLATACGTFTGSSDPCDPDVGDTDRLYRFAESKGAQPID